VAAVWPDSSSINILVRQDATGDLAFDTVRDLARRDGATLARHLELRLSYYLRPYATLLIVWADLVC
jgi:hypothetical protein